jgi:hypothetical protein
VIVPDPHRAYPMGTVSYRFCYFAKQPVPSHMSNDSLDNRNINSQCSTSFVIPRFDIVLLIIFLLCLSRMKQIFMIPRKYVLLFLKDLGIYIFVCNHVNCFLQYTSLSNEVGLTPCLSIRWYLLYCQFFEVKGSIYWGYSFDSAVVTALWLWEKF